MTGFMPIEPRASVCCCQGCSAPSSRYECAGAMLQVHACPTCFLAYGCSFARAHAQYGSGRSTPGIGACHERFSNRGTSWDHQGVYSMAGQSIRRVGSCC